MADPCIHGPGVLRCGHPDCTGYRDFARPTGTFAVRHARREILDFVYRRGPVSWEAIVEFMSATSFAEPADILGALAECLRLNNPRIDLVAHSVIAGSTWTSRGFDYCEGGHPGGAGDRLCGRCGRCLDMTPCGCDYELSRSFCPRCRVEEPYPIGV